MANFQTTIKSNYLNKINEDADINKQHYINTIRQTSKRLFEVFSQDDNFVDYADKDNLESLKTKIENRNKAIQESSYIAKFDYEQYNEIFNNFNRDSISGKAEIQNLGNDISSLYQKFATSKLVKTDTLDNDFDKFTPKDSSGDEITIGELEEGTFSSKLTALNKNTNEDLSDHIKGLVGKVMLLFMLCKELKTKHNKREGIDGDHKQTLQQVYNNIKLSMDQLETYHYFQKDLGLIDTRLKNMSYLREGEMNEGTITLGDTPQTGEIELDDTFINDKDKLKPDEYTLTGLSIKDKDGSQIDFFDKDGNQAQTKLKKGENVEIYVKDSNGKPKQLGKIELTDDNKLKYEINTLSDLSGVSVEFPISLDFDVAGVFGAKSGPNNKVGMTKKFLLGIKNDEDDLLGGDEEPENINLTPDLTVHDIQQDIQTDLVDALTSTVATVGGYTGKIRGKGAGGYSNEEQNGLMYNYVERSISEESRKRKEKIDADHSWAVSRFFAHGRNNIKDYMTGKKSLKKGLETLQKNGPRLYHDEDKVLQEKGQETADFAMKGETLVASDAYTKLQDGQMDFFESNRINEIATNFTKSGGSENLLITQLNQAIQNPDEGLQKMIAGYEAVGVPKWAIMSNIKEQIVSQVADKKYIFDLKSAFESGNKATIKTLVESFDYSKGLPPVLGPYLVKKYNLDLDNKTEDEIRSLIVEKFNETVNGDGDFINNFTLALKADMTIDGMARKTDSLRVKIFAYKQNKISHLAGVNMGDKQKSGYKFGRRVARNNRRITMAKVVGGITGATGLMLGSMGIGLGVGGFALLMNLATKMGRKMYEFPKEVRDEYDKLVAEGVDLQAEAKKYEDKVKNAGRFSKMLSWIDMGATKRNKDTLAINQATQGKDGQNQVGATIDSKIIKIANSKEGLQNIQNGTDTNPDRILDTLARFDAHVETGRQFIASTNEMNAEKERAELMQSLKDTIIVALKKGNMLPDQAGNPIQAPLQDLRILQNPNHHQYNDKRKEYMDKVKNGKYLSDGSYTDRLKAFIAGDTEAMKHFSKKKNVEVLKTGGKTILRTGAFMAAGAAVGAVADEVLEGFGIGAEHTETITGENTTSVKKVPDLHRENEHNYTLDPGEVDLDATRMGVDIEGAFDNRLNNGADVDMEVRAGVDGLKCSSSNLMAKGDFYTSGNSIIADFNGSLSGTFENFTINDKSVEEFFARDNIDEMLKWMEDNRPDTDKGNRGLAILRFEEGIQDIIDQAQASGKTGLNFDIKTDLNDRHLPASDGSRNDNIRLFGIDSMDITDNDIEKTIPGEKTETTSYETDIGKIAGAGAGLVGAGSTNSTKGRPGSSTTPNLRDRHRDYTQNTNGQSSRLTPNSRQTSSSRNSTNTTSNTTNTGANTRNTGANTRNTSNTTRNHTHQLSDDQANVILDAMPDGESLVLQKDQTMNNGTIIIPKGSKITKKSQDTFEIEGEGGKKHTTKKDSVKELLKRGIVKTETQVQEEEKQKREVEAQQKDIEDFFALLDKGDEFVVHQEVEVSGKKLKKGKNYKVLKVEKNGVYLSSGGFWGSNILVQKDALQDAVQQGHITAMTPKQKLKEMDKKIEEHKKQQEDIQKKMKIIEKRNKDIEELQKKLDDEKTKQEEKTKLQKQLDEEQKNLTKAQKDIDSQIQTQENEQKQIEKDLQRLRSKSGIFGKNVFDDVVTSWQKSDKINTIRHWWEIGKIKRKIAKVEIMEERARNEQNKLKKQNNQATTKNEKLEEIKSDLTELEKKVKELETLKKDTNYSKEEYKKLKGEVDKKISEIREKFKIIKKLKDAERERERSKQELEKELKEKLQGATKLDDKGIANVKKSLGNNSTYSESVLEKLLGTGALENIYVKKGSSGGYWSKDNKLIIIPDTIIDAEHGPNDMYDDIDKKQFETDEQKLAWAFSHEIGHSLSGELAKNLNFQNDIGDFEKKGYGSTFFFTKLPTTELYKNKKKEQKIYEDIAELLNIYMINPDFCEKFLENRKKKGGDPYPEVDKVMKFLEKYVGDFLK